MPNIFTDDDRSWFVIEFPIHPAFLPPEKGSRKTASAIIDTLRNEPELTISELSEKLEISTRAIEKHLQALKRKGGLRRVGGRKNGAWEVID